MLILRGEISKSRERQKNQQTQHDLNLILNKWTWNQQPFQNSEDFLTKMGGWIDKQIKQSQEWENFMKKWKIKKLDEIIGIEVGGEE